MKNKVPKIYWLLLAIVAALFIYIRLRLLSLPFEGDEGEYSYAGQLILKGSPPYKDIYNMKFPGVYYFYSLFLFLFGNTDVAIRLGSLLVNLLSAWFIFKTGEVLRNRLTAVFATIGFLVLSTAPHFQGLMANTEVFVNLFVAAAAYFIFFWIKNKQNGLLFVIGVLAGFACLMKQHGAYIFVVAAVAVIINGLVSHNFNIQLIKRILLISAGFILVMLLLLFSVWITGTFSKFVFLTIDYGRSYISYKTFSSEFFKFFFYLAGRVVNNHIMWLAILAGIFISYQMLSREIFWVLLSWLMLSIAAVFPGYYFRTHYYLYIVPPSAIYFGLILDRLCGWSEQQVKIKKYSPLILITACLLNIYIGERAVFFLLSPGEASAKIYNGDHTYTEAIIISNYIRQHSLTNNRILVVGSEPEIYFYSQRKAATGYVYDFPLIEQHPLKDSMIKEFAKQVLLSQPEYVVNAKVYWYDYSFHQWAMNKVLNIDSNYVLKGFCYSGPAGKDIFVWNNNEKDIDPTTLLWEVYRKKPSNGRATGITIK